MRRNFQLVRFLQIERFEQLCQGELSFSFAKVNSDTRQHVSRLFSFTRVIKYILSFLPSLFLFTVVHGLVFNLFEKFSFFCNSHWCYTCCAGVTLFALVLHLNCTALSQSKSSNFFMYIIS